MLAGAEFLALILIVVYVGAVAVLFLFVTMMLDVDFASLRTGMLQYAPIGVVDRRHPVPRTAAGRRQLSDGADASMARPSCRSTRPIDNTRALGQVIYTRYVFLFQGAGAVLLVAMVGAIVLTLQHKPNVKRQDAMRQIERASAPKAPSWSRSNRGRGSSMLAAAGIGLGHYLTVGAILFTLGVFGIFLNRKNIIIILMSVELILLAVNINFVAFSAELGDLAGQVFALLILTVAAAEAAIGLAILVIFYRNRGTIAVEDVNSLKG